MDLETHDLEAIRQHYLFAGLDERDFATLRGGLSPCWLDAGETVFHRGDAAAHFFLVGHGQIELFLLSKDGDKKVVEVIERGQTFAEAVAFMKARRYPVHARAMRRSMLYRVSNITYLDILRRDPDACLRLVGDVCQRLHARLIEIQELTIENANHRLARYLLAQIPEDAGEPATIELTLPRQVIASRLSMQPETLSRLLKGLVEAGIIAVQGRTVQIRNREALESYE